MKPNDNNSTNTFSSNQNVSDKHLGYTNSQQSNDLQQGLGMQSQVIQPSANPTPIPSQTSFANQNSVPQSTQPIQPRPQQQTQVNPTVTNTQTISPQTPVMRPASQPILTQQPRPVVQSPQPTVANTQTQAIRTPQAPVNTNVRPPVQSAPRDFARPVQPSPQAKPLESNLTNPQQTARPQYLNPLNFQGQKNVNISKEEVVQNVKSLPIEQTQIAYPTLEAQSKQIVVNTFEILKLSIYIVPTLPVFLLLLRSTRDKEVMWHVRQSLVTQAIWLVVLFILNSLNAPLVSGNGITLATLWNILFVGILVYAGSQAYLGRKWAIPVIHEIGIVFIEEKN